MGKSLIIEHRISRLSLYLLMGLFTVGFVGLVNFRRRGSSSNSALTSKAKYFHILGSGKTQSLTVTEKKKSIKAWNTKANSLMARSQEKESCNMSMAVDTRENFSTTRSMVKAFTRLKLMSGEEHGRKAICKVKGSRSALASLLKTMTRT